MLVLIYFLALVLPAESTMVLLNQLSINVSLTPRMTKLLFHIDLQIRPRDRIEGDLYAATGSILENHGSLSGSDDQPTKIALAIQRLMGLDPDLASGETLVIRKLVQPPLDSG